MPNKSSIILVGPMAAGKSTVGTNLAQQLGTTFYDTDQLIERRYRRTVAEIFQHDGEARFRRYETEAIRRLRPKKHFVLATGGGAVLSVYNRQIMKKIGFIIYLRVSIHIQMRRVPNTSSRPLLAQSGRSQRAVLQRLSIKRTPLYRSVADYEIDTDHYSLDDIVSHIASLPAVDALCS